jgi:hypothetical protein
MSADDVTERLIDDFLADLRAYLVTRQVPAANRDELIDDAATFVRSHREHPTEPDWAWKMELPPTLALRANAWCAARRERLYAAVKGARRLIGYDSVPFPGDDEVAATFWKLLTSRNLRVEGAELSSRFNEAVKSMRARVVKPSWDEGLRYTTWRDAMVGFTKLTKRISEQLDLSGEDAALWILSGREPKISAAVARGSHTVFAPPMITISVNPGVATPEEVRSLYRTVRRRVTVGERLRVFLGPTGPGYRLKWKERWPIWNELHPLYAYKSPETLRVAASRERRKKWLGQEEQRVMSKVSWVDDSGVRRKVETPIKYRILGYADENDWPT